MFKKFRLMDLMWIVNFSWKVWWYQLRGVAACFIVYLLWTFCTFCEGSVYNIVYRGPCSPVVKSDGCNSYM